MPPKNMTGPLVWEFLGQVGKVSFLLFVVKLTTRKAAEDALSLTPVRVTVVGGRDTRSCEALEFRSLGELTAGLGAASGRRLRIFR